MHRAGVDNRLFTFFLWDRNPFCQVTLRVIYKFTAAGLAAEIVPIITIMVVVLRVTGYLHPADNIFYVGFYSRKIFIHEISFGMEG